MKTRTFAITLASLSCAAAFAQTTNTFYGVLDVDLMSMDSGYGQSQTIGSGGMSASRLGLNGERKLEGDLKAVYVLEAGLSVDSGVVGSGTVTNGINNTTPSSGSLLGNGSQIISRQVYFGLKNDAGALTLGRQYSGSYGAAAMGNAMGVGLLGSSASFIPAVGGMPTRLNNSLVYLSPAFSGLTAQFTYTTGSENNVNNNTLTAVGATTTTNASAGRGYDLALSYANGPLYAALTTWSLNNTSYLTAGETDLAVKSGSQIVANYDFGSFKLFATAASGTIAGGNYETVTKTMSKSNAWSLSGSMPFGKTRAYLSYSELNDQSTQSKSAQLIGLGLTYSLYEKTTVYASYGKMSNNGNASYSLLNSGDLVGNVSAAGVSPTGAMVGLNLAF